MLILIYRVRLDLYEFMSNNPNDRELARSLIMEYFSLPPDDNNMMEERAYHVCFGDSLVPFDEKEHHWRNRRTEPWNLKLF